MNQGAGQLIARSAFVRLAWVLQKFREATRPVTGMELAKQYEVSLKTIDRDIEILRNMGCDFDVVTEDGRPGIAGRRLRNPDFCPFCNGGIARGIDPEIKRRRVQLNACPSVPFYD